MQTETKYFITNSNGFFVSWHSDIAGLETRGQKLSITTGSIGDDSVYVGRGTQVNATGLTSSRGNDSIYLTGTFDSYTQHSPEANSTEYKLSRIINIDNQVYNEIISFVASNGDKVYFSDGYINLDIGALQNTDRTLKPLSSLTLITTEKTPDFPLDSVQAVTKGNNTHVGETKIFISDPNGENISPGIKGSVLSILTSSIKSDTVYVAKGTQINAIGLTKSRGEDSIYLTGNFAEYTQAPINTSQEYKLSRMVDIQGVQYNESVIFVASNKDRIYFADGYIKIDKDILINTDYSYKALTAGMLDTSEITPGLGIGLRITDDQDTVTKHNITYTFTFDKAVKDFDISDIMVADGSNIRTDDNKGIFATTTEQGIVSGTQYTLVVTPENNFDGDLVVSVANGAANALTGTKKSEAAENTQAIDTAKPMQTVTVNSISNDTGLINDDFITNMLSQTINATLSATLKTYEKLYYRLDGHTTTGLNGWTMVSPSQLNSKAIAIDVVLKIGANQAIVFKIIDEAGNEGTTSNQAYIVDRVAPIVSSKTSDIYSSGSLQLIYDETITKGSGNIVIYNKDNDVIVETIDVTSAVIDATDYKTVNIKPLNDLSAGFYYAKITKGAFKDIAGNEYMGINDKTWDFSVISLSTTAVWSNGSNIVSENGINFDEYNSLVITGTLSNIRNIAKDVKITSVKFIATNNAENHREYTTEITPNSSDNQGQWTLSNDGIKTLGLVNGESYVIEVTLLANNIFKTIRDNTVVLIDTIAPEVPVAVLTDDTGTVVNRTNNGSLSVNENINYAKVEYFVTQTSNTELSAKTAMEYQAYIDAKGIAHEDGYYSVRVRATNSAGNTSETIKAFTLDTSAPIAPVVNLADDTGTETNRTNNGILSVTENPDYAKVAYFVTQEFNAELSEKTKSEYQDYINAKKRTHEDGDYSVRVVAIDGAGNTSEATKTFTLDTSAPILTITMDSSSFKIGETATITFTFTETPVNFTNEDITVDNGTIGTVTKSDSNEKVYRAIFTPKANIIDATNVIHVGSAWEDSAGNMPTTIKESANYTIDNVAPIIDVAYISFNTKILILTLNKTVTGSPDVSDFSINSGVTGSLETNVVTNITVDGNKVTLTLTTVVTKNHEIKITYTQNTDINKQLKDSAGNVLATNLSIITDLIVPTLDNWSVNTPSSEQTSFKTGDTIEVTLIANKDILSESATLTIAGKVFTLDTVASSGAKIVFTYNIQVDDIINNADFYIKQDDIKNVTDNMGRALVVTETLTFGLKNTADYIEKINTDNPFNGVTTQENNGHSVPAFVDMNGDGNLDLIVGKQSVSGLSYYENNNGYIKKSNDNNPFSDLDVGLFTAPTFADIDDDGDLDLIVGRSNGKLAYFKNQNGVYTLQGDNLFSHVNVYSNNNPTFADIDEDGDLDLIIGSTANIYYYKNIQGTYTKQTNINNPFNNIIDLDTYISPAFVDVNGDGKLDLVTGNNDGKLTYYKNTGSAYVKQTNANSPFNHIDVGDRSTPTFVDIDNDGYLDLVIGNKAGTINYFYNLPNILVDAVAPVASTFSSTTVLASDLKIEFSEKMKKGTGFISIYEVGNDASPVVTIGVGSSDVVINNKIVSIQTPNELMVNGNYYIKIDKGALTDMSGNDFEISSNSDWLFKVASHSQKNNAIAKVSDTNTHGVDALDSGKYWNLDSTRNITYSFNLSMPEDYNNLEGKQDDWEPLNNEQKLAVKSIFTKIEKLLNVTFSEVADTAHNNDGSIQFNITGTGKDVAGYAYFPGNSYYSGDVFLSNKFNTDSQKYGLDAGEWGSVVIVHEIGHALGLEHSFSGGTHLPNDEENRNHSIMSYTDSNAIIVEFFLKDGGLIASENFIYPQFFSLYDVAALQAYYGVNETTNTEDTTYSYKYTDYERHTIWDAGGDDLIDLSLCIGDSTVDLSPGSLNSVDQYTIEQIVKIGQNTAKSITGSDGYEDSVEGYINGRKDKLYTGKDNLGIATGTIIENITTGSGNDIVTNNMVDNIINTGHGNDNIYINNGGHDIVDGGDGKDNIHINISKLDSVLRVEQDYSFLYAKNFTVQFKNIEELIFNDGSTII